MSTDPRPWLAPLYAAMRARSLDLVQRSIAALQAAGEPVTAYRIVETSRRLDPTHRGISEGAVRGNPEARACYLAARVRRRWSPRAASKRGSDRGSSPDVRPGTSLPSERRGEPRHLR